MRDILKAIENAPIPCLGISREEMMHYVLRAAECHDYDSIRALRGAVIGFERKNPNRGSDEEVDRLVDGNLYWICHLADEFADLNGIPYEQRCRLALQRSTKGPSTRNCLVRDAYRQATGYAPAEERKPRAPRKTDDYRSN
jgi:hypothetical protein